jgi:hypothetical protein
MQNAKIVVKVATPAAAKMASKLQMAQKFAAIEKVKERKNRK